MTKDMTTGPITPLLVNFTIPLVLGNLFQLTYNAVDSIIVGKFVGEDALAAVGTSNPLMTLAILFINGVCLGAGILVSLAFGAGDTELVERQVSTTAIAGSVFSLVFSLTCVILANPLLRLLQVPEEILPIAVNYLRIVFGGLLFTFFYNFLAATMRALGDSKSALYFLMISSVLNIGGDLFFVEVLDWGSEGCALSTVLSEALCCVFCLIYIRWKVPVLQLGRRWFIFDSSLLKKTISYGWGRLSELYIGKTDVIKRLELSLYFRYTVKEFKSLLNCHIKHIGYCFSFVFYLKRFSVISLSSAYLTGNIYVRKEVHFYFDYTVTVAGLTSSAF